MESIFIAIPSMADTETSFTVENAILSAEYPERVFVGVSFKDLNEKEYKRVLDLSKKYPNISVDFKKLKVKKVSEYGTGDGRWRSHRLYSGQDYMLQVDSHTLFEKNWDSYFIDLFKECKEKTNLEKFVLTSYIPYYSYTPERVKNYIEYPGTRYPFYVVDDFFLEYLPKWEDIVLENRENFDKFIPCVKFNGAFAFGNKDFINNTGVFKEAIFYDEELIQAINLIGNDFAMVFPNVDDIPIAHLYADDINEHGGDRTYFNDLVDDKKKVQIANKAVSNYINFISDPKNKSIVKKYEKYARINCKRGAIIERYVPKVFIIGDLDD
jgi:hypothetical protein